MVATAEVPKGVAAERLRRHCRRRHVMARVGLYVAAVLAAFICARSCGPGHRVQAEPRPLQPENSPFFFNLAATPTACCTCCATPPSSPSSGTPCGLGLLVVAITLVLGLPAAYSLARLDRPWSGPMAIAISSSTWSRPACCSCPCRGWS